MTILRTRRTYDHRIREMICETGHPDLFPELKIPRSTIRSWLHRGIPDVVTSESLSAEKTELLIPIQELHHRLALLGAIVGLMVVMLRVSERRVDRERLPEGDGKRALLRAIERASRVVPRWADCGICAGDPDFGALQLQSTECGVRSAECPEMQQT